MCSTMALFALPSLVAFGSLTPWPTPDQLQQLTQELQRKTSLLEPLTKALRDLPGIWQNLAEEDVNIRALDGKDAAERLAVWATGSVNALGSSETRNMVALPITIVTHIVQYFGVLEHSGPAFDHQSVLKHVSAGGGIQGFCAGLLTALAVASGKSEDDVAALAATAISLAFCVGAYVDLDQARAESGVSRYTSLAVRWRAPTTCEDIQQILRNHTGVGIPIPVHS